MNYEIEFTRLVKKIDNLEKAIHQHQMLNSILLQELASARLTAAHALAAAYALAAAPGADTGNPERPHGVSDTTWWRMRNPEKFRAHQELRKQRRHMEAYIRELKKKEGAENEKEV